MSGNIGGALRKLFSLLFGFMLLAGVSGCVSAEETGSATEESESTSSSESGETESEQQSSDVDLPVAVGTRYSEETFALTINSVRTDGGGGFAEPDEDVFLILDITLENLDDESTNISELLQFELQGSDDFKYDLSIFAETKGDLGGNLAAGSQVRGEVAFDVPLLDSYTMLYQHDLLSDSIPFIVNSSDLDAEVSEDASASEPTETSVEAGVGDTVTQDGVSMTVNSIRTTNEGSLGSGPDEETYLIVDATIENNSDDSLNLSSLLSFDLRGSDSYAYDVSIFVDTQGDLGGEVRPGSRLRGEIAYDVPLLDFYELSFEPSFFSGEPIMFVIYAEDF